MIFISGFNIIELTKVLPIDGQPHVRLKSNLISDETNGGYFFLCIFIIATINMATPKIIVNSSYIS